MQNLTPNTSSSVHLKSGLFLKTLISCLSLKKPIREKALPSSFVQKCCWSLSSNKVLPKYIFISTLGTLRLTLKPGRIELKLKECVKWCKSSWFPPPYTTKWSIFLFNSISLKKLKSKPFTFESQGFQLYGEKLSLEFSSTLKCL